MALPGGVTGNLQGITQYIRATYFLTSAQFTTGVPWLSFNDETDTSGYYTSHGSPEGVVAADKGSVCSDTSNGNLYTKTTDTANTGWLLLATSSSSVSSLTGTQNQVLVNATFGSPVVGAVTLTTPQDIGTTSSPTFLAVFGDLGSASNPTFASSDNALTGIYFPDANTIGFSANGNANFIISPFVVQTNKLFQFFSGMSTNYTIPGAYPYSVTDSADNVIYVDTSVARTINLPNLPTDGRIFTIKDASGLAGTNPITITTPGGTVTIDGVTSKSGNVNWGSWTFQFRTANYFTIAQGLGTGGVPFAIGTANQVLVNGTSGSQVSGIITLTTPQDIATTSSVTFGNVTLGNAGALRSTTVSGNTALIQVYNNTSSAYNNVLTMTNGTTPTALFTASVGSATTPAYSFLGQTNYGMYYASSQTFLAANGTGWFSVSSGGVSASVGQLRAGGILTNLAARQYFLTAVSSGGTNNVTNTSHWSQYNNTAARTSTLPSASLQQGQVFIIQDGAFNAATNAITNNVNGGVKTINGFTSLLQKANGASMIAAYDGTNYNILASHRMYSTALGRIVDKNGDGDFTTIAAATAAAVSGDTIFIRNGTYTENWTPKDGVRYTAFSVPDSQGTVKIVGKMSISAATVVSFSNIYFQTNADNILSVSGTANVTVNFYNCYLNMTNSTGVWNQATGGTQAINFYNCDGDVGTTGISWFIMTRGGLNASNTNITNSGTSLTASTFTNASAGAFTNCSINVQMSTADTAGIGATNLTMRLGGVYNITCLALAGTGSNALQKCNLESGSATPLTIGSGVTCGVYSTNLDTSNTNAVSGAGQLTFNGLTFSSSSSTIASTLIVQQPGSFYGAQLVFVGSVTANNSTEIIFKAANGNPTDRFQTYLIIFDAVLPATDGANLQMQISNDGGSTWINSGYQSGMNVASYDSATFANTNNSTAHQLTGGIGNGTNSETGNGEIFMHKCNRASASWLTGKSTYYNPSTDKANMAVLGGSSGSTGTNAFRLFMSSGNITDGTFTIYGLKTSY